MNSFPCPCCGHFVFDTIGSDKFCPICKWQDDLSQLRFVKEVAGPNKVSLFQAQKNYVEYGVSVPTKTPVAIDIGRLYTKDPLWRVIDVDHDDIEESIPGMEYGATYPKPLTRLYYWRDTYWRKQINKS